MPLLVQPETPQAWARADHRDLGFPMFHPHDRSVFTMRGVIAAVSGTRKNMKLLWIAYASASCVQIAKTPILVHLALWANSDRKLTSISSIIVFLRLLHFIHKQPFLLDHLPFPLLVIYLVFVEAEVHGQNH